MTYMPYLAAKYRPAVIVVRARTGWADSGRGAVNGVPADQAVYYIRVKVNRRYVGGCV